MKQSILQNTRHTFGRLVVSSTAAEALQKVSNVFFKTCVDNLKAELPGENQYIPWMSSLSLVKSQGGDLTNLNIVSPNGRLDFSKEYLVSLDEILRKIPGKNLFNEELGLKIYSEIREKDQTLINIFESAVALVGYWDDWQKIIFQTIVKSIVPLVRFKPSKAYGFSDHDAVGAVFLRPSVRTPYPAVHLNIALAHELSHQVLTIYQFSSPMIQPDEPWIYSAIRKELRPPSASLHAAIALCYMIEASRSLQKNIRRSSEAAYLKALEQEYVQDLKLGLAALDTINLTTIGEIVVSDLRLSVL